MFCSGNGFTISVSGQQLQYTMQITPSTSKDHHCAGLCGNLNGDPADDLTASDGTTLNPQTATPQQIFAFGQSCESNTCILSFINKLNGICLIELYLIDI